MREARGGGAPEKSRNKPRRRDRDDQPGDAPKATADAPKAVADAEQPQPSFDLSSSLPPSFSGKEEREGDGAERKPLRARAGRKPRAETAAPEAEPVAAPAVAEQKKPRPRGRPRKAAASDGNGDSLETVG
ncbi:hypothetical protein ACFSTD_16960 [Novosphingobium colocasiae]